MRKVILYMTMTLDGFVAGPGNDLEWFTPPANDPELDRSIVGIVESVDTWLMGYPTAPGMVAYWREVEKKGEKSQAWEMAIARAVNRLHPIAISNVKTEEEEEEEKQIGKGEIEVVVGRSDDEFVSVVNEIKSRRGGGIYVPGGVRTGQKFARLGLVDEYVLMIHPVAIGEGKRLFTIETKLELISARQYRSGVAEARYRSRSSVDIQSKVIE